MPNIQVLTQETIDKIAAGEVVDRPASIVKELLENAIDAKSNAITVEIKEGGISFIRITDNGCGIAKDELGLAFLRHATSKIRTIDDLSSVSSLGFRGEALSSIGAVSQMECITKTPDSMTGCRYVFEGGVEKDLQEVGAPTGTTFIIRNLFYNTPARRKFLKSATTEGNYITAVVEHIAFSHPEVSIRLIVNGNNKLFTPGNNKIKDIIYGVYGREIAANLIEVHNTNGEFQIEGYIGKPMISRGNRNFMNYFINGRYIKSKIINSAIEDAYKPYMMHHNYPFTVLHFTMNQEELDVNVHPAKMELRFEKPMEVYQFIFQTIVEALKTKEMIPKVSLPSPKPEAKQIVEPQTESHTDSNINKTTSKVQHTPADKDIVYEKVIPKLLERKKISKPEPFEKMRSYMVKEESANYQVNTDSIISPHKKEQPVPKQPESVPEQQKSVLEQSKAIPEQQKAIQEQQSVVHGQIKTDSKSVVPEQLDLFQEQFLSKQSRSKHRIIGQVFDTYWLVEFEGNLYIIDQHAAHEKVLYEKTMADLKEKTFTSQTVNPPIILTLSQQEEQMIHKYEKEFQAIGYEIEPFGGNEYAIRGVPANLYSIPSKELLLDLIDSLSSEVSGLKSDLILEKIASASCKAAVKGHNKLSYAEAESLIDQLLELENPYHCPHGRPTIITMSKYEIEKKFKRII